MAGRMTESIGGTGWPWSMAASAWSAYRLAPAAVTRSWTMQNTTNAATTVNTASRRITRQL